MTVWAKHGRCFCWREFFHSPRTKFAWKLTLQPRQWKAAGEEIILYLDANEHLYTGPLAQLLQGEGILMLMLEKVLASTGQEAPYSHCHSRKPILGVVYATPGIKCLDAYVAPHENGVGDHCLHILDFYATSALGIEYQRLVRPTGRKLQYEVEKLVICYNWQLKKLFVHHGFFDKLENLMHNQSSLTPAQFKMRLDTWDSEFARLKLSAEEKYTQFYSVR